MACGAKQWNNDFFFINAKPLAAWREEARGSCMMDTAAAKCGGRTEPGTVPALGLQGGEEAGWSGGFAEAVKKGGLPSPAVVVWGSLRQARAEPRALLWLRSLSALCALQPLRCLSQSCGAQVADRPPPYLQSGVGLGPSKGAWEKCHPRRLQSTGAVSALDGGRSPGYPPSDLCSAALGTGSRCLWAQDWGCPWAQDRGSPWARDQTAPAVPPLGQSSCSHVGRAAWGHPVPGGCESRWVLWPPMRDCRAQRVWSKELRHRINLLESLAYKWQLSSDRRGKGFKVHQPLLAGGSKKLFLASERQ